MPEILLILQCNVSLHKTFIWKLDWQFHYGVDIDRLKPVLCEIYPFLKVNVEMSIKYHNRIIKIINTDAM